MAQVAFNSICFQLSAMTLVDQGRSLQVALEGFGTLDNPEIFKLVRDEILEKIDALLKDIENATPKMQALPAQVSIMQALPAQALEMAVSSAQASEIQALSALESEIQVLDMQDPSAQALEVQVSSALVLEKQALPAQASEMQVLDAKTLDMPDPSAHRSKKSVPSEKARQSTQSSDTTSEQDRFGPTLSDSVKKTWNNRKTHSSATPTSPRLDTKQATVESFEDSVFELLVKEYEDNVRVLDSKVDFRKIVRQKKSRDVLVKVYDYWESPQRRMKHWSDYDNVAVLEALGLLMSNKGASYNQKPIPKNEHFYMHTHHKNNSRIFSEFFEHVYSMDCDTGLIPEVDLERCFKVYKWLSPEDRDVHLKRQNKNKRR